jgi:Leucine Rich repeat
MNPCLQILRLGQNNEGNDGAEATNALRTNTNLVKLDLNCSTVGDEGAKAILTMLNYHNRTLMSLNLDDNAEVSWMCSTPSRVGSIIAGCFTFYSSICPNRWR